MAGHSKWANIQHRKGKQDALRGKVFVITLLLTGSTSAMTSGEKAEFDLSALPPLPIEAPAHVSEVEILWECGQLDLPPDVPEGWSVRIEYGGSSGSLNLHYSDDVIEAADFRPLSKDPGALPRALLRARSGCFELEVTVREGRQGTSSYGCGSGVWVYELASPHWIEPECVSDPPPRY
jgi:hypothetical protein